MKDIILYNFEFIPVLYLPDAISVNWFFYYNDIGTFELHMPISEELIRVLQANPYLVAVQGDKQAIITARQIHKTCVLYGRSCNWILTRRVTNGFAERTERPEVLACDMVQAAFRDVENWACDPGLQQGEMIGFSREKDSTTFDAVQDCLQSAGLGHEVYFDVKNKKWRFGVKQGNDLSLVVSESLLNAYDSEYAENCLNYYNGGWFYLSEEAEDSAAQQKVRTYLNQEEKHGIYRWECVLSAEEKTDAQKELKNKKWERHVKAKTRNLMFGRDYSLGDFVLFELVQGDVCSKEKRIITGVHLWYEAEGCGEEPIFEEVFN